MKLYLQFGFGMMAHANELLDRWRGGGVILSPRDLEATQLVRMASDARKARAEVLLDPQCYAHDADHQRLTRHDYWKIYQANSTAALLTGPGIDAVLQELARLATSLGVQRHILPGLLASEVNEDWLGYHEHVISRAKSGIFGDAPLIATIALSNEALRDEEQIEAVVERAANWDVDGFYVVGETPDPYLVEDAGWLGNLLILTAGLKLIDKQVIVGYCNHQLLALASANVDVIASGTWLNVRAFQPDKFYTPDEDKQSRRTVWYYCPQALSEYKIPTLDLAQRLGVLPEMTPPASLGSSYADVLFRGAAPSTTAWAEQSAFRHYLTSLHAQTAAARLSTYADTVATHQQALDSAERLLQRWKPRGVAGADRDFSNVLDANRGALALLEGARGAQLKRQW